MVSHLGGGRPNLLWWSPMFSLCLSVSYIISAFGILGGMVASLYPSWVSEALGNEQFPRLLELKIRGDGAHNNSIWCQSSHSFSHVPCLSFTILLLRSSGRLSWLCEWRSIWGFCWEALLLHQDGWLVPYSEAVLGSPSSLFFCLQPRLIGTESPVVTLVQHLES